MKEQIENPVHKAELQGYLDYNIQKYKNNDQLREFEKLFERLTHQDRKNSASISRTV